MISIFQTNYLKMILNLFILLFCISCTNYQMIKDSLTVMDESVENIELNSNKINKLYLKQLESLLDIIEANRLVKIDTLYSDFALGRIDDPNILTLELAKINEITASQKEKVRDQIRKFKEELDLSQKNYISYKEISGFLSRYINVVGNLEKKEDNDGQ